MKKGQLSCRFRDATWIRRTVCLLSMMFLCTAFGCAQKYSDRAKLPLQAEQGRIVLYGNAFGDVFINGERVYPRADVQPTTFHFHGPGGKVVTTGYLRSRPDGAFFIDRPAGSYRIGTKKEDPGFAFTLNAGETLYIFNPPDRSQAHFVSAEVGAKAVLNYYYDELAP